MFKKYLEYHFFSCPYICVFSFKYSQIFIYNRFINLLSEEQILIGNIVKCFRALTILQENKQFKKTTIAFLKTIVSISNVLFQIMILLIFCSIFGLHIFYGLLENRCRLTPYPINGAWLANPDIKSLCGYNTCPEECEF